MCILGSVLCFVFVLGAVLGVFSALSMLLKHTFNVAKSDL